MAQYDKFAKVYIERRTKKCFDFNRDLEMPIMFKMVGKLKGKKLLDIGCGFGEHAKTYSKHGATVIGIDLSKKEIEYAKSQKIKNAEFFVRDITKKFPFKANEFDILTSSFVLDYIENLYKLFKECYRVLKKDGEMVFSIPNPVFDQGKPIAGILKEKGRRRVFGDYFKSRWVKQKWRGGITVSAYHQPLENFFSAFLKAGFKLTEFREGQPSKSISNSAKSDYLYKDTLRIPTVIFIKLLK